MKTVQASILVLVLAAFASAGTITFTPSINAAAVGNAINSDGFFATGTPSSLFGAHAYSEGFHIEAYGLGYSDAGLVVGFNGGLTLGEIQSVAVESTATSSPLAVNLWLDTGGDGHFFTFNSSSFLMTATNDDSYAGCGAPTLTGASSCYMLGGTGSGSTLTLAALQSGAISGIGGNTPVALWIGITNPGNQTLSADISKITITTTEPVPEPATLMMFGTGLMSVTSLIRRKAAKK